MVLEVGASLFTFSFRVYVLGGDCVPLIPRPPELCLLELFGVLAAEYSAKSGLKIAH